MEKMTKDFEQLEIFLTYVQRVDPKIFVMYRSGYITIATWDEKENLKLLADAPVYEKFERTMYLLYQQFMKLSEYKVGI